MHPLLYDTKKPEPVSKKPVPAIRIAVLTSTIPGRQAMLVEASASVEAQKGVEVRHLIDTDEAGSSRGAAMQRLMVRAAEAECVAFAVLDDDNRIADPQALKQLWKLLNAQPDGCPFVTSRYTIQSASAPVFSRGPRDLHQFTLQSLETRNFLHGLTLFRTGLAAVIGFDPEQKLCPEYALSLRLWCNAPQDAQPKRLDQALLIRRLHAGQIGKTRGAEQAGFAARAKRGRHSIDPVEHDPKSSDGTAGAV